MLIFCHLEIITVMKKCGPFEVQPKLEVKKTLTG